MTRHQNGISALVSQASFRGETSGCIAKCRLFNKCLAFWVLVFCNRKILGFQSSCKHFLVKWPHNLRYISIMNEERRRKEGRKKGREEMVKKGRKEEGNRKMNDFINLRTNLDDCVLSIKIAYFETK